MSNPWANLSLALNGRYDSDYNGVQAINDLKSRSAECTGVTPYFPQSRNSRNIRRSSAYHHPVMTNRSFTDEYENHRSNVANNPRLFESDVSRILTALG